MICRNDRTDGQDHAEDAEAESEHATGSAVATILSALGAAGFTVFGFDWVDHLPEPARIGIVIAAVVIATVFIGGGLIWLVTRLRRDNDAPGAPTTGTGKDPMQEVRELTARVTEWEAELMRGPMGLIAPLLMMMTGLVGLAIALITDEIPIDLPMRLPMQWWVIGTTILAMIGLVKLLLALRDRDA